QPFELAADPLPDAFVQLLANGGCVGFLARLRPSPRGEREPLRGFLKMILALEERAVEGAKLGVRIREGRRGLHGTGLSFAGPATKPGARGSSPQCKRRA